MITMQSFEVLKILNSFEIKSDRISAECGIQGFQTISMTFPIFTHPSVADYVHML
jgi:hypothetical protein